MTQPRGFTLVEVLVVMVIIGVLAGALMLAGSARGETYRLREEAERFSAVVRLVADEAVLDSREYGIRVSAQGYEVWGYNPRDGRWQPLPDAQAYRLPAGMQLTLTVEGMPLPQATANRSGTPPQIVLSSAAQWTPFNARVQDVAGTLPAYQIHSDGLNDPQVLQAASP